MKAIVVAVPSLVLALAAASPMFEQQQPLTNVDDRFDLINELRKAEIIPTVLDPFHPFLTLNISWKKASAEIGNSVKPKKLQRAPLVQFVDDLPDLDFPRFRGGGDGFPQLTLALTDPDAKSRDNPIWSEMCHWIATGIPLAPAGKINTAQDYHEVMPYKAPGPPPKTGKHRYVFAALAPKNGTHETLHLSKPKDRQHWGYGKVRTGLRQWAEENGLVVIGANFIYAQDKKQ